MVKVITKQEYQESEVSQYASWMIGVSFMLFSIGLLLENFLAGIIVWIGCLVLLPPISQRISKKMNKSMAGWKWLIFLGCFILGIMVFIISSSEDKQTIQEQQKTEIEVLNLEGLTPEQILDKHVTYCNWVGVIDELNKIKLKKQLLGGIFLKFAEARESFLESLADLNSEALNICDEIEQAYGMKVESCKNVPELYEKISQKREILSKEKIEETQDTAKVKMKFKNVYSNTIETNESIQEAIYIFKKECNVWKIYDSIDESGKSLLEIDLEEEKEWYNTMIQHYKESNQYLKEIVEKKQQFNRFVNQLETTINKVIPADRRISTDLDNKNPDRYVISITYHFKDVSFVDDYLQVMYDASELFKTIFPLDSKIYQVQTIVKKTYTDDYGNTQEKYLATTSMTRETYNKINWEGFESSKLDKITEVNFYETSFYKGLTELQELSDRLKSSGSGVMMPSDFSGMGGMSFCSEFQLECQQTGDCKGLQDMQSMGLC